jgi:hypothetical protein
MRRLFLAAILSASAALISAPASADPVKRVLPQGKDGDYYYYQVECTDGTQGTVVIQDKEDNVCAQASGGQRVCNASWTVPRAAEQACR